MNAPIDTVIDRGSPAPARSDPPQFRRPSRSDLPWAAGAILLAPVAWVLSGGAGLLQAGGIDAFVYTGYANHYAALLQRYGVTYYSTRVATIFPEAMLGHLFGPLAGYYAWHYVLAVVALGSVYGIARRYYGVPTAAIATVLLVAVPWLASRLIWDYVDGPAIAYLLLGMFLVLGVRSRPALRWFLAGCVFSLAITCNLWVLAIVGAFGGAWLLFGFAARDLGPRVRGALFVVGGVVVTQVGLGAFMALRFPQAGFWFQGKAVDTANGLLAGGNRVYFVSWSGALRGIPFLWVPIVAAVAAVVLACATPVLRPPPERRRLVFLAATYLGVVWLAFVTMHNLGGAALSLDYYVSYFIPAFFLVVIVTVGELMMQLGPARAHRAALVATAALVVALGLFRYAPAVIPPGRLVLFLGVGLVCALPLMRRWPVVVSCIAGALIFVLPFAFSWSSPFALNRVVRAGSQTFERDVYRHAVDFQDGVLGVVPTDRSVGFWYDGRGSNGWLNSVQSTFLWGSSRLSLTPMPNVDASVTNAAGRFDYVVLLSPRARPVRAGASALCRIGVGLAPVAQRVLRGDAVDLHYTVFQRNPSGSCPPGLAP